MNWVDFFASDQKIPKTDGLFLTTDFSGASTRWRHLSLSDAHHGLVLPSLSLMLKWILLQWSTTGDCTVLKKSQRSYHFFFYLHFLLHDAATTHVLHYKYYFETKCFHTWFIYKIYIFNNFFVLFWNYSWAQQEKYLINLEIIFWHVQNILLCYSRRGKNTLFED